MAISWVKCQCRDCLLIATDSGTLQNMTLVCLWSFLVQQDLKSNRHFSPQSFPESLYLFVVWVMRCIAQLKAECQRAPDINIKRVSRMGKQRKQQQPQPFQIYNEDEESELQLQRELKAAEERDLIAMTSQSSHSGSTTSGPSPSSISNPLPLSLPVPQNTMEALRS